MFAGGMLGGALSPRQMLACGLMATSVINIAFLTGIQIHGPGGINYVCPRRYELTINGRQLDQDWAIG